MFGTSISRNFPTHRSIEATYYFFVHWFFWIYSLKFLEFHVFQISDKTGKRHFCQKFVFWQNLTLFVGISGNFSDFSPRCWHELAYIGPAMRWHWHGQLGIWGIWRKQYKQYTCMLDTAGGPSCLPWPTHCLPSCPIYRGHPLVLHARAHDCTPLTHYHAD